jgi:glycosyltransferase involved in cell wall biosynthesis
MRVIHLSTQHSPLDVRIFHKECRTLAAAGHEVHLLVGDAPDTVIDGVHFHRVRKPTTTFRPGRIGQRLLSVLRHATALRGQVVHFHDPELILVGLLLKRRGARVVYDVHEDAPQEALSVNKDRPWNGRLKSWAWLLLEGAARRVCDAFVCATPAIARKFPPQRTVTVQNFPLLEEFTSPGSAKAEAEASLVYVGNITAIRGAREMVRALDFLPESLPGQLWLAGPVHPPGLLPELERLAGWRRVDYLGVQPRPAVRQLLSRARLGVVLFHPERDHLEAMPNKLFEYMAAGLPVVASDFPLWRQIVAGGRCGLLVDPLNPPAVASAIRFLLEHPAEATAMGRRGRSLACERYSWQPEARKLLDLYKELEGR